MTSCYRWMLVATLLWAVPVMAQQFPDGAGKETTLQLCGNCHNADVVAKHRQGRDEWIGVIQKMMESGAEGTPEQFKSVLDYLVKNFGPGAPPINLNKATAAELESGLTLTAKEAAAIVKHRTENGAFKTVDDLKKVPDCDFKKIEAQKARLVF